MAKSDYPLGRVGRPHAPDRVGCETEEYGYQIRGADQGGAAEVHTERPVESTDASGYLDHGVDGEGYQSVVDEGPVDLRGFYVRCGSSCVGAGHVWCSGRH